MSVPTRSLRRNVLSAFMQFSLPAMLAMSAGHAATCTVNSTTDDPADAATKVNNVDPAQWPSGPGPNATTITLRDCIVAANLMTGATGAPTSPGMTIDTTAIAGSTITLGDALPLIFNNTTIGPSGPSGPLTIDGSGHRIFFVSGLPALPPGATGPTGPTGPTLPDPDDAQLIAVSLSNLVLQNGNALGGTGGGGGLGAGGALFVNKNATVTLAGVDLKNNTAAGGGGGAQGARTYGGGGMGGSGSTYNGGGGLGGNSAGDGGGGIGTDSTFNGGGFGGTGIGQISSVQGFAAPDFGGGIGSPGSGGIGGGGSSSSPSVGGFGGGGGSGSDGGFAGGGGHACGECGSGTTAGVGGFGGGGGASRNPYSSYNTDGTPGRTGAIGGFGAGGAAGSGGGGCFIGASGPTGANGGVGGVGGAGGVGAGSGGAGATGASCTFGGGSSSAGSYGGSGGGAGFGGGVFVRAGGTLIVQQPAGSGNVSGNAVTAGAGGAGGTGSGGGGDGAASGSGLFLMSGATTTFDIATTQTISDNIQDDSAASLPGGSYTAGSSGGAGITKQGAGTLIFGSAAVDTYAGPTTIDAGTLQLDGVLTASPITINSGGTLGGTGGTVQSVTLNSGGVVAPGDSPGTLSGSSLTWNGGGVGNWELGVDNTSTNSDVLSLNSNLNKGSAGTYKFHFTDGGGGPPTPGTTYTLIRYNATNFALDASDFTFDYSGALAGGLQGTFALSGSASPPPVPATSRPTAGLPPNALTFAAIGLAPTISKAFGAATVPLNGITTLTFTITNPNANVALAGLTFSDSLPAGLVVAAAPNVTDNCGGTFTATAAATSVDLSGGTVGMGTSCTILVDVQGTTAGVKNNTTGAVSATGAATGTTSNTASVTVIAPPIFQKGFSPPVIGPAGTSTLTFSISNTNSSALTGLAFTDTFPAGLVVAAAPNAADTCGGTFTATAAAGSVSLTGGTVGANAACSLTVDVHGTTPGTKDNTTGTISSTEGGTGGTASASLTINVTPVRLQSFEVD